MNKQQHKKQPYQNRNELSRDELQLLYQQTDVNYMAKLFGVKPITIRHWLLHHKITKSDETK